MGWSCSLREELLTGRVRVSMASRGEVLLGREPSVNLNTEPGEGKVARADPVCVARSCSLWAPASSFVNR